MEASALALSAISLLPALFEGSVFAKTVTLRRLLLGAGEKSFGLGIECHNDSGGELFLV